MEIATVDEVEKDDIIVNNDFLSFIALLPKVQFPFETNCERCCDHPKIDYKNDNVSMSTGLNNENEALIKNE